VTATTRAPYRPRHAAAPQPVAEPQERRLRVVPAGELSPRARRRRNRLIAFTASLIVCAGLFGVVAFHVVLTQGQLELDRLHSTADEEQSRYDRNRLLVAELESPERIVNVAQARLGMVPPPDVTYLSPTGIKVDAGSRTTKKDDGDDEQATSTSWPAVKAHLAGRR
jgi:cell division protein FtsL